ncbi:MAG: hypothetical protein GTO14_20945 [Anaerolineales bacterium]|nr:hypothetical protein [Anaerolineales bacterium]
MPASPHSVLRNIPRCPAQTVTSIACVVYDHITASDEQLIEPNGTPPALGRTGVKIAVASLSTATTILQARSILREMGV